MAKEFNYQHLNQELEEVLDKLQAGDLDIDEALKLYERGQEIVDKLQTYLKQAENKVTKVKKSFES